MSIRAVIFDIIGVLLSEVDTGMDKKWEARLGLKEGDFNAILGSSGIPEDAVIGKIWEQELRRQIGALFGVDDEQVREFANDLWLQHELNTELAQFLKSLRSRYKTAMISNGWPDTRQEASRRSKLDQFADIMVFSAEEG